VELNKKTIRSLLLGAAGCILLYWLLHETERLAAVLKTAGTVLAPFVIGAAIAFALNVPMRSIEKWLRKIEKSALRRACAIVLTLLAVIAVLFVVVQLIVPQIGKTVETLISELPGFFNRCKEIVMQFLAENPEIMEWLNENTDFEQMDWSGLIQKAVSLVGDSASAVMNSLFTAVGSLSSGIFDGVMSFFFALYCLARKEILAAQGRRLLYAFLPEKAADETVRILRLTNATFSNFISGQCLEAVILGAMFAVSMPIFGFPYVPLVSVMIAVTALVPIVGAFAGCILGALFILVESPVQAFWFVALFLLLQQIEGNLIYPRVVGTSIGLPGMWVLVALAVGGDLMGVGGMLLMIPATSVAYALLREVTNRRLEGKNVPGEKLAAQPQEISSKFRERRLEKREKRKNKAAEQQTSAEKDPKGE